MRGLGAPTPVQLEIQVQLLTPLKLVIVIPLSLQGMIPGTTPPPPKSTAAQVPYVQQCRTMRTVLPCINDENILKCHSDATIPWFKHLPWLPRPTGHKLLAQHLSHCCSRPWPTPFTAAHTHTHSSLWVLTTSGSLM